MVLARSQRYSNKRHNQPGPSQVPLLEDAEDDGYEEAEANMDEDVVGNAESVSIIQACNTFGSTIIHPPRKCFEKPQTSSALRSLPSSAALLCAAMKY